MGGGGGGSRAGREGGGPRGMEGVLKCLLVFFGRFFEEGVRI